MYTIILIGVLSTCCICRFWKRIPTLKRQDKGDKIADFIQVIVVATISGLNAIKLSSYLGKFFIFCMTFFICTWIIRLLVEAVEWLQAYKKMLTLNGMFAIGAPIVILWHMPRMNSLIEIEITFMTLILSIGVVYGEVIHIVTNKVYEMNKALKIKGILTWLMIVLINLYTLLVFVQFYMGVNAHHFIKEEYITKEAMIDLLYYLIVTFTTVGFGDISPETALGKMITCVIAITGMLFTGMFMGAILSTNEYSSK